MAAEFTRGLPVTTRRELGEPKRTSKSKSRRPNKLSTSSVGVVIATRVGCTNGAGWKVSGCEGPKLCEMLDSLVVRSRSRSKRETLLNQIFMVVSTDGHGIQIVNQGSALNPFCSPLVQFKTVCRVMSQLIEERPRRLINMELPSTHCSHGDL